MDTNKGRLIRGTSIFIVLESLFLYYILELWYFVSTRGIANPGFPFNYVPGVGYIVKTFYPLYWSDVYHPTNSIVTQNMRAAVVGQLMGVDHFMIVLWTALIIASVITLAFYGLKFKGSFMRASKDSVPNA
jgi:hypothetical protein